MATLIHHYDNPPLPRIRHTLLLYLYSLVPRTPLVYLPILASFIILARCAVLFSYHIQNYFFPYMQCVTVFRRGWSSSVVLLSDLCPAYAGAIWVKLQQRSTTSRQPEAPRSTSNADCWQNVRTRAHAIHPRRRTWSRRVRSRWPCVCTAGGVPVQKA